MTDAGLKPEIQADLADASKDGFNQNQKQIAPAHIFENYQHASENAHRTAEQFKWKQDSALSRLITLFTFGTVLFAGLAFYETKRQAVAAEGQLAEATRQGEFIKRQTQATEGQLAEVQSENRPYIVPIIMGGRAHVTPQQVSLITDTFPPTSGLSIKNFGITPAIIRSIAVQLGLSPQGGYPRTEYHTTDLILESKSEYIIRLTPPIYIDLVGQDYRRLVTGEIGIYLKVAVNYLDVAGATHTSQFCYLQVVSGKGGLRTDFQPFDTPGCANKAS